MRERLDRGVRLAYRSAGGLTGRFLASGSIAAAVYFAASYAFLMLGLAPFAAGLIGYGVAFVVGYGLQQFWTFSRRAPLQRSLPRYLALQAGCALVSGSSTLVLARWWSVPALAISLIVTLLVGVLSYLASKSWVFVDSRGAVGRRESA
jgi:putative flippase GtrA